MWVSFRGKTKMAESKMGQIQDGCHHQVESEWTSDSVFCVKNDGDLGSVNDVCLNPRCKWVGTNLESEWISLRGNTKMAESKMAEFKMAAIIKLRWEWMSLSQIELVWVRVLCKMEWESKMSEFWEKITRIVCHHQDGSVWIQHGAEVRDGVRVFLSWIWDEGVTRCLNPRMLNPNGRIQDGCHHQVESCANGGNNLWWVRKFKNSNGCHHQVPVRMNEFDSDWISLS